MVNKELVDYIKNRISSGASLSDAKEELKIKGWAEEDIDDAAEEHPEEESSVSEEGVKKSKFKRNILGFMLGVIIVLLIFSVYSYIAYSPKYTWGSLTIPIECSLNESLTEKINEETQLRLKDMSFGLRYANISVRTYDCLNETKLLLQLFTNKRASNKYYEILRKSTYSQKPMFNKPEDEDHFERKIIDKSDYYKISSDYFARENGGYDINILDNNLVISASSSNYLEKDEIINILSNMGLSDSII